MHEAKSSVSLPHHVINHLPDGDLQSSYRLMGRQDVRQPCEAHHAGHRKQYLRDQLGVLLMPVVTDCETGSHNQTDKVSVKNFSPQLIWVTDYC